MTIAPLREELLPSLRELFAACNSYIIDKWTFNPKRTVLMVHDGQVVGFVTSWWDEQPIAWVDLLLVHPEYRGRGIALTLCQAVAALLRNAGAQVIRCVLDEGAVLPTLLAKHGFLNLGECTIMEMHYNEV